VCPIFWTAKSVRQLTTFTTHFTTKITTKTRRLRAYFSKTPTKTLIHHGKKKSRKLALGAQRKIARTEELSGRF